MASLPVSVAHLYKRKQSPYPRLKPLLFVPSENLNIALLSRLIDQLPTPFFICGDFNGHSITWGCDKNNSQGDIIDDFITDNNICLLNDGSYTYLHPATGTFTVFDLSLFSPDILVEIDFMVESNSYGSDHFKYN